MHALGRREYVTRGAPSDKICLGVEMTDLSANRTVRHRCRAGVFGHRYNNDATGRLAYDPKVRLKILLYGYCRGIVSSRRLAEACCHNVVFMALSADSRPHFTTIASFVSK